MFLVACQAIAPTTPDDTSSSSSSAPAMAADDHATNFTSTSVRVNKAASSITFVGGSTIVDHPGSFGSFDVTLALDSAQPQNLEKAVLTASIDIASVKTDSTGVDGHFQREDFFDAANYPQATFRSTSIRHLSGDNYAIAGDLTMKGVTKSVTMNATITDDGLDASFDIVRADFGIAKDTYGQKLLDATVPVTVKLAFE